MWWHSQVKVPRTPSRRQLAVALRYQRDTDNAPKILATGKGRIAERLLQKAKLNDIPIHEDAGLAQVLSSLAIGEEIPEHLFRAVAEILAFIYRMDRLKGHAF